MLLRYKKQQGFKMILMSLAVLFFDQIGKFLVLNDISGFSLYTNYEIPLGVPFDLHLLFIALITVIVLFKRKLFSKCDDISIIAFSLLIGGIISNSFDRFLYGFVIDYFIFFNLFVFNLADLSIFFGLLIISWKIFRK
ncbi:MAG: signal peptidase II [Candidatus Pacebacteria bacterium]|nr:signal peptidase II [Candidatus Paceibacterota bacterium]